MVEEAALRRMNLAPGDRVRVGDVTVEVRGIIAREPDRGLNAFASLGPRLMIPFEAVTEQGLVQPGSLLNWEYRLRLPPGSSDRATIDALKSRFPDAGWRVRGLAEAGGGIRFWLDRLTQFIGLIGLASLLVGGVGVGNAISSFLAARLRTIAIMKCLGAPERLVLSTYLIQLAAIAVLGVVIGLVIGALLPFLAQSVIAEVLPVRARVALYAEPLAIAAAFGLLVSLLFALVPLMRARRVPAATLMRGAVVAQGGRLPWRDALLIGAVAVALAAFTIFTADSRSIAGWFVLGAVAAFVAFPLLARLLMLAPPRRQAQARRLAAGARQPAPARRADAHRHAVAGVRPHRAGGHGADRGQPARTTTRRILSDAPGSSRRHPVDPDGGLRALAVPGARPTRQRPARRIVAPGASRWPRPCRRARWAVEGDRGVYSATPPEGSRIGPGAAASRLPGVPWSLVRRGAGKAFGLGWATPSR